MLHKKLNTSKPVRLFMYSGLAVGELLPPMIVDKAMNMKTGKLEILQVYV